MSRLACVKKCFVTGTLSFLLVSSLAWAKGETLSLDPAQSSVAWEGKKVTGGHHGTIKVAEGKLEVDNGELKGGEVVIDMNSLVCEDLKEKEYNDKFVGHMKSDDFFSVAKHPTSKFAITKVTKQKDKANTFDVEGDMTIKGVAQKVNFPVVLEKKDKAYEAKGEVALDRTRWDIRYGSGKFFSNLGDKAIYDDFKISFTLKTK